MNPPVNPAPKHGAERKARRAEAHRENARDKALVSRSLTLLTPPVAIEQGCPAANPAARLGFRLDSGAFAVGAAIAERATVAGATAWLALRDGWDGWDGNEGRHRNEWVWVERDAGP